MIGTKKDGIITAWVTSEIKAAKRKTGYTWRGLIIRGIKDATKKDNTTEQTEKIGKMAARLQEQSVRIYKLEQEAQ